MMCQDAFEISMAGPVLWLHENIRVNVLESD